MFSRGGNKTFFNPERIRSALGTPGRASYRVAVAQNPLMWQKSSTDEFAAFEQSQGEHLLQVKGMYWRRVRRCFYRPLLLYQEFPLDSLHGPTSALLGGYQFAVPPGTPANSRLNLLLFTDPKSYTLATLERHKRKQVNSAARHFTIRPIEDIHEFKQKAHPVYVSFYERTQYSYMAERRDPKVFSCWADSVYRFPKNLILGAFQNSELHAVSISMLVEDTVVYSMVFCTQSALRLNVNSLLLHHLRVGAAATPDIKQIFVGMYKFLGRTGIDDFYFVRGCELVSKPAALRLNPFARVCLRAFMPSQYRKLRGQLEPDAVSRRKPAAHDPLLLLHPSQPTRTYNLLARPFCP
jgi:hypothetical protein